MAYYINKKNKKPVEEPPEKKKLSRTMRSFYQILGCVIVLIIVLIIWFVRGGEQKRNVRAAWRTSIEKTSFRTFFLLLRVYKF